MVDITKCKGDDCPLKNNCYRYTSHEDIYQSYFVEIPFKIENGKFTCDMFWGESSQKIFEDLNNIVNGKGN